MWLADAESSDGLRLPPEDDDFWFSDDPALPSKDGRVTTDSAMRVSAVNGCVRAIVETVSMLPLITYKRLDNGGKRRATDISLYHVLHDTPNEQQTSFEFREMLTGHMLLRGNGFAEILTDERGAVEQLIPLHPDRVEIETIVAGGRRRLRYQLTEADGSRRPILQDDMFHLRGMSFDGISGVSVIEYARETIALARSQQQHGRGLFENGANPGGVLTFSGTLTEPAKARLAKDFDRGYAGSKRTGKTLVLEEGMTWSQVGLKSVDAEWLDSMKLGISDIARFFRMPPHMIQDLDRATNNNIEEQGREFVTYTMMPHFRRWEGAIRRDLILAPRLYFVEFNVDALLRGSTAERLQAYQIGRNIGMYSPNELREMENLNPREDPGGDEYLSPLNMDSTKRGEEPPAVLPKPKPRPVPVPAPERKPRRAAAEPELEPEPAAPAAAVSGRLELLARKAAARVLRREVEAGRKLAIKHAASADAWRAEVMKFYRAHASHVAEALEITAEAATTYAARNAELLAERGVIALETWRDDHIDALTRLTLEGGAA